MRRLVVLLGTVLALVLSGTAAADTFVVVHPSHRSGGVPSGVVSFASSPPGISFAAMQPRTQSPSSLRSIWQAAGATYGIPWEVLAAINKVETDFGRNLGPSSAGAIGWMQFLPSTWARWGIDANGDGVADPNNPTDAIFSAARYLAACGGQTDIAAAIYCYNHADWYVNEVLSLAALYGQGGGNGVFALSDLQARLDKVRTQIETASRQLVRAVAQARALGHAEQRLLRKVSSTSLLSNRLAVQKRATLVGIRRDAALARVSRLRRLRQTATAQLAHAQDQASTLSLATSAGGSTSLQLGRTDQGVDMSAYVPYAALAPGRVVYVDPNFWQGTPAVYEQLDQPITVGGRSYDEIYYSETQALVHVGQRLAVGQPVIAAGSAEIGFARGNLPAAHGTYHEGSPTQAGLDFRTYLTGSQTGALSSLLGGPRYSFQAGSGGGAALFTTAAGGMSFTTNVLYFTH
jgi:hypothetical protein